MYPFFLPAACLLAHTFYIAQYNLYRKLMFRDEHSLARMAGSFLS
jgi:hypothetical protein